MRYAEEIRNGLAGAMDAKAFNLLEDRYRYALVREVNAERNRQGLPKLDASPVYLAHPRLDLYASQDSPHPMDQEGPKIGVGCTSCHDGSGQETDFVLTAHVPRPIWVDAKTGDDLTRGLKFGWASGFHIQPDGSVFISDYSARRIVEVSAKGELVNELRTPDWAVASVWVP